LIEQVLREAGERSLSERVYVELLEACRRLAPKLERSKGFEMIFKDCADRGYVNEYVLHKLRKVVSPDLYPRLTNQDPRREPSIEAIPDDWKRNVN
jgi:hypothetical protein